MHHRTLPNPHPQRARILQPQLTSTPQVNIENSASVKLGIRPAASAQPLTYYHQNDVIQTDVNSMRKPSIASLKVAHFLADGLEPEF